MTTYTRTLQSNFESEDIGVELSVIQAEIFVSGFDWLLIILLLVLFIVIICCYLLITKKKERKGSVVIPRFKQVRFNSI